VRLKKIAQGYDSVITAIYFGCIDLLVLGVFDLVQAD
jgi:hypothetical protein